MRVYSEYLGKEFETEKLEKAQGTYEHNSKTLWLIQDPYPSDLCGHEDEYTAVAIDSEGETYRVTWKIVNSECEDASESCDWDVYNVETL